MKTIDFDCPCCKNIITITLDDKLGILSVEHICKNLEQTDNKFLYNHNIEFGVVNFNKE